MSSGNTYPIGVYVPAASAVGQTYVQCQVTNIGPPATFIGNISVVNSTATAASQVYVTTSFVTSYPWSKYLAYGTNITTFIEAFSG